MVNQQANINLAKLKQALFWNYLSLIFFGLNGLGVAGCIAYFYNAQVLGYFNLINAIYMVLMQVSTMGIHHSILMHLAQEKYEQGEKNKSILSAFLLSMSLNLGLVIALCYLADFLAALFHDKSLSSGIKLIAPALLLFSGNKVLLWALNGLRRVKAYALLQALRYVSILFVVLLVSRYHLPPFWLITSFLIAEVLVFAGLMMLYLPILGGQYAISSFWLRTHFAYGLKGIASGLFLSLNLNIDLIILALFVNQHELGVYSLASVLVIGLYQLLTAIRVSLNPELAKQLAQKNYAHISMLITKARRFILLAMVSMTTLILLILPVLIRYFLSKKGFDASWYVLSLLLLGVLGYASFFPFDQLLAMGGYPGLQTLYNFSVLGTNAVLNILFVPQWGMYGAAFATTLTAAVVSPLLLNSLTYSYLRVNLFRP